MRVSRNQMQANRLRILDEAGRLFRERGFEAVSVAEVMKAAGLTHGGFYGHFESKDDLFAQSIAHGFAPATTQGAAALDLPAFIEAYLSAEHRSNAASGCPTAALAADVRRQAPSARVAMTEGVREQLDRIASALADRPPEEARRDAVGTWATLVGALVLSRSVEDEALADQILADAKAWIGEQVGPPGRVSSPVERPAS
jgi:TetR/AcrR family transcriptional repressor of nem operon